MPDCRLTITGLVSLAALAQIGVAQHPSDPIGKTQVKKTRASLSKSAGKPNFAKSEPTPYLYEFEYTKWTPSISEAPPAPLSSQIHTYLLEKGNTEAEIARYDENRQKMSALDFKEKTEIGTVVVRRLGDVVAVEKVEDKIKIAGGDWMKLADLRRESLEKSKLKGVELPEYGIKLTHKDYANGDLVGAMGNFGVNGREAMEIDRTRAYDFPMTIGNGILAVPLAGVSIKKFCNPNLPVEPSFGKISFKQTVQRNGRSLIQAFDLDAKNESLLRYAELHNGKETFTVEISNKETKEKGAQAPSSIVVNYINGRTGDKIGVITFKLKKVLLGDSVDVSDLRAMGPKGKPVSDNRLNTSQAVRYTVGDHVKPDWEVASLAKSAIRFNEPVNNESSNFGFMGFGFGVAGLTGLWVVRGTKKSA